MFAVQSIGSALFFTGLQKKNPENNAATYYNVIHDRCPLRIWHAHQISILGNQNRSRRADNHEPAAQAAQPAAPMPAELEPVPQPEPPKPAPTPAAKPVPEKPQDAGQEGTALYPYWPQVVQQLQEKDPMLYTYLRKSKAYFDGTRVLIDGGKTFRDFIRANKDSQRLIKKLIKDVSGTAVPIGPYEPKSAGKTVSNAEQSLRALEKLGLDVSIEDSARKTRS